MRKVIRLAAWVVHACDGNPVLAILTVLLFFLMFNLFEYTFEVLVWGKHFLHWFDLLFIGCFIAFSAVCVWQCAAFNMWKRRRHNK